MQNESGDFSPERREDGENIPTDLAGQRGEPDYYDESNGLSGFQRDGLKLLWDWAAHVLTGRPFHFEPLAGGLGEEMEELDRMLEALERERENHPGDDDSAGES